jgi:hypothetical protein
MAAPFLNVDVVDVVARVILFEEVVGEVEEEEEVWR